MRTAIWIGAFIVIALAFTAWVLYTRANPDFIKSSPDFTMTSSQLFDAFKKDSQKAAANFNDKIIRLKGVIKQVDTSGAMVITDGQHAAEIILAIDPRYQAALRSTKAGDTIIAQGVFSTYTDDIGDPDDLLSGLGATIRFRNAGIIKN
jgi:hypothetical protein